MYTHVPRINANRGAMQRNKSEVPNDQAFGAIGILRWSERLPTSIRIRPCLGITGFYPLFDEPEELRRFQEPACERD